jgi:2-oxoglutarate ferredoxin oxidoreductase subunit beta
MSYEDWFREDRLPHIFCAGCGNGTIINCTLAAVDSMGWKKEETVFVSGIGCSSRAPGYILADSLHTTHGRALPFATGVKMANPDLKVVVFTGDGDLAAIGGNHFIHACRRNIDLTVVCMNNQIYGMTGGQGSPTTPKGCLVHYAVRVCRDAVRPLRARDCGRGQLCLALDIISRKGT